MNKLKQRWKICTQKLQDIGERNKRWHKEMLMDWENKYHWNVYTTQSNLHILFNPYQNTNRIFHRTRTEKSKIYLEPQ